jgi:hypothetical protein
MVEVGEAVIRTVNLASSSFSTVSAPPGETQKISMVYAKEASTGEPRNDNLNVAPATGAESGSAQGAVSVSNDAGTVGGNLEITSNSYDGLQPIFIDDTTGLYIGNDSTGKSIDVIIQGVRIS